MTTPDARILAVTFRLAEQRYALPLEAVLQVVRLPDLTMLAGAPPAICGLLNLHGQFVPVVDGRVLVGAEPTQDLASSIMVLALGSEPALGLLADAVEAVRAFPLDSLAPVVHGAAFIAGVLRDDEGSIILLGPEALHGAVVGGPALQPASLN